VHSRATINAVNQPIWCTQESWKYLSVRPICNCGPPTSETVLAIVIVVVTVQIYWGAELGLACSFAYTMIASDESQVLGCVYFFSD